MPGKNPELRTMLWHGFTAPERAYLEKQPEFSAAVRSMANLFDFERACDLGHKLLAAKRAAHNGTPNAKASRGQGINATRTRTTGPA